MQYKGKTLTPPPRNTKYIPVKTYSGLQDKDMAITDIEVVGDSQYCKIGEDVFFWDYIAQNIKDASIGLMCDLYPETFMSMKYVHDQLDLGNRTDLSAFFACGSDALDVKDQGCKALIEAPMMDTSKITNMSNMFGGIYNESVQDEDGYWNDSEINHSCTSLTTIPQYNTSNVTNFRCMFQYCENLRDVPELDTSKAEDVRCMFQGCTSLPETFPWAIDISSVTNVNNLGYMFGDSSVKNVSFLLGNVLKEDSITPDLFGLPNDGNLNIRFKK